MSDHVYRDPDGQPIYIVPSMGAPGAFIDPAPNGGVDPAFRVPAHKLAEFCAALYRAAGQPVPDLPVIHDPELLDALAKDIRYAIDGTGGAGDTQHLNYARTLLAHGWGKL